MQGFQQFEPILLKERGNEKARSMEYYRKNGGYEALKKALFEMSSDDVIREVTASGLRGRGGAGFPTGIKWGFVPKDTIKPKFVVVNFDEGEPGTFKDRDLGLYNPHLLIEGAIIAGYAIGAQKGFIYIRAEYPDVYKVLENAIEECYKEGVLGDKVMGSEFKFHLDLFMGAGAYICGEETALLESLEGKPGQVRMRPPYPATKGLFGCPTVVNNVETLCNVPLIIKNGAQWFRSFGTETSTGTKIFSVSGAVERPGNYEFPMGSITLRELIEEVCELDCGKHGDLFCFPGGISTPILKYEEWDVKLDFESLFQKGSSLGSGAVIVMDPRRIPFISIARRVAQFFSHESCGKCTPCRDGTPWLYLILRKIENHGATEKDLDLLKNVIDSIKGKCLCPLGESDAIVLGSLFEKFPEKFESLLKSPI